MRQILLVRAFLRREVESRSTGRWVSRTLYPVLAEEASGPCCLKACLDGRGSRGMRSDLGLSKAILSCFEDCRALAGFRRRAEKYRLGGEEDEAHGCTSSGTVLPLPSS